jgi:hypothetical protein
MQGGRRSRRPQPGWMWPFALTRGGGPTVGRKGDKEWSIWCRQCYLDLGSIWEQSPLYHREGECEGEERDAHQRLTLLARWGS